MKKHFFAEKNFYEALKTCSKIELSLIKAAAGYSPPPLVNFNMSKLSLKMATFYIFSLTVDLSHSLSLSLSLPLFLAIC